MQRIHARLAAASASVALVAAAVLTAPAAQAADQPVLTKWANPGVARDGAGYVMTHTVNWNKKQAFATAAKPNGPWKRSGTKLLTKAPAWANAKKPTVWAPSLIRGTSGTWVVYYSALVRGSSHSRCIGTGTSASPTGPYVPDPRPITCWKGSRTKSQDVVPNERSTSIIDATPAVIGAETVLTFKTEHGYRKGGRQMWHTSIRMLKLDPAVPNRVVANPANGKKRSIRLTSKKHRYIEENPSLVVRGTTFTLFTSWGWYGTHDRYWTQYRQVRTNPWRSWNAIKPTRLKFPKGTNTRGQGNAQAVLGDGGKSWLFWNGQETGRNYTRGEGPKRLFVGTLGWPKGKPVVRKVLRKG